MTNKYEFQNDKLLYKCVSCGNYYEPKKPRKGRKFCSNTCRAFHWYQNNPDAKKSLGQGIGTDELLEQIAEKDALIRSLQKQNAQQYQDLKNDNAELFNQNEKLKSKISQVQGTLNYQNQEIAELKEQNENIESSVSKIEKNIGIGRQLLIAGGGNLLAKLTQNAYRKVRGQMTDREILLEIQKGTRANHNLIKQVPQILNNAKPQMSQNQMQDYRRLKIREQKRLENERIFKRAQEAERELLGY